MADNQTVTLPPDAVSVSGLPPDAVHVGGEDTQQPKGSALGRYFSGIWSQLNPVPLLKTVADVAAGGPYSQASRDLFTNIVSSHADQIDKAKAALDKGEHVEAAGHFLGAMIPILGPAAANVGEQIGGTDAVYDKYGHVVTPGKAPDVAGGLGSATGLLTSVVAPEAVRQIPGVKVSPALKNPNPVKGAAANWAVGEGIPVPADVVTGNSFAKVVRQASESSLGGSFVGDAARQELGESLAAKGRQLADQAAPGTAATPESAGASIAAKLTKEQAGHQQLADAAYDYFRSFEADPANTKTVQVGTRQVKGVDPNTYQPVTQTVPITKDVPLPADVTPVKDALRPIYNEMVQFWEPARRYSSPGFQAIESILKGPDVVPASIAEKGLGGLKQLARDGTGANAGLAKFVIPQLQDIVDHAAAQAGPDAVTALQQGRSLAARSFDIQGLVDDLRKEPVQAFNQLTMANDAGVNYLRSVASEAPGEMPKIGRAFVENLMDSATAEGGFNKAGTVFNGWEKLGPETKQILFPNPGLRSSLNNFFQVAKMTAEQANPSRTALSLHGLGQGALLVTNPVAGVAYTLGSAGLVKLLYSPAGVRALTNGLKVPLGNPAAAAMAAGQIIKLAGKDAQPVSAQQQYPAAAQTTGQSPQIAPFATALPLP